MSTLNHTFGVSFFLKKQNKDRSGKSPVYARITVNGKRAAIAVKQNIEEANWNAGRGMAKGIRKESVQFNKFLEQYRAGIVACYQQMVLDRKIITAETIKDHFLGVDETEHTLCRLMEYHHSEQEHALEWGTLRNYFTTEKYVLDFLRERYKVKDIYLSALGYKFISD